MADLRDYKNKDFSITVNSRMKGIELRFENTMTEEQIEQIKEAGFRWSKRQQMWYAYQNEKTIAYAKSLESNYEANFQNNEIKQEKAESSQVEQTVLLQDLIAELREEIRKQNEKIKELEEIIEERNNENEEILLEAENGEKMTIDEYNQWNEEQVLQEEIDDLQEGKNFISSLIQEESEIILTEEELEICRKIIPANQYAYTLDLTQGEEGDFYKQKLKDIAKIAMQITTNDELVNNDGTHNVGFHYFVGNSDFYISEIKSDGTVFGYTILNGDVEMAEWGYQNIEEIINVSQWIEMDYHVPEGMTIERMLEEKYPEYYKQESVVEIEHQSGVVVPREKIFSIFNKYISNEEYATEEANKFIKGWENKDFNRLAERLVFKKDTTAELRKLFNETEKVSLPEGNANYLDVYTYLTKFADVETIPAEGKFNTWNDVIDYDIEVRTSLENKKNIFHFFQTHTSQTERTNYLKKEYSNRGGGVLPFNYVYTSDGIYLKALIDGKIKEKSYTWAEYTKFISDKISQGTYYTEPKIEKVTNKLIPSFNLLNEKYAIEFEPADEGKIDVNSEADKWIVKFYDISKVIPGEIDKGRFIQKYYASSLLQNQNSTVGLNLGYGWSLDAETFNRVKEIIKDFVLVDMSEIFNSKQNNTQQEKTKIENDKEYARELADWIIQYGLENSVSQENYIISYDDIIENTDTTIEWLNKNYELVNEALAEHNDNELLEYDPEESNENDFNLYFCSNATEKGENTLFKQNKNGRWVRKTDEELELELQEESELENEPVYTINGIEYLVSEIEAGLREDIRQIFQEYDASEIEENLVLNNVKLYKGENIDQLSLLVEYDSKNPNNKWTEYALFNALAEESISFAGMKVDINPITPEKSGTIEEYLKKLDSIKTDYENANNELSESTINYIKNAVNEWDKNNWQVINPNTNKLDLLNFYRSNFVAVPTAETAEGQLLEKEKFAAINELYEYSKKHNVEQSELVENIIKDYLQEKNSVSQSQNIIEPHTKKDIKAIREQCREILQKSDNEITEEDKLLLAQYEGGGGINEENRTSAQVLNEFYTPNNLIEKVWNLVDAYHPNGKTVLEPTAGIGKFANNRPNNQFTMHELDETSARINKILHPETNVIQGAYQKQFLDETGRVRNPDFVQPKYDIVIGNPPYGEYSGQYKAIEGKHHQRYEEYFIEKGLDALKDENSILAYVVPSGFLDSKNDKQKELIASKGQFVDAYRLPAGTFSTTDVGTDILIMRSWDKVRKEFERDFIEEGSFITKEEAFKSFQKGNAELLSNGEHFKDHPEKILGEIKQRTNQFGKLVDTVVHHEGLSIQDELNKIDNFVADIKKGNTYENHQESNIEIIEEELEELEVIEEVSEQVKRNFILEKLSVAGIEVISEKDEFERILKREDLIQKMLSSDEQKKYFTFNEDDTKEYIRQIDEWKNDNKNVAKLINVGNIPPIMKVLGIAEHPIKIQYSTLNKAIKEPPKFSGDKQGHKLTLDDIYSIPLQLANPVMVFKSRTRNDSYVFFTERKDYQNRSIIIPLVIDKNKGRLVIHEITSMYGRNNEIDFVRKNLDENNILYVDKKRSLDWERSSQVQFLTQRFSKPSSSLNILTKEQLVNFLNGINDKNIQNFITQDGTIYGFAHESKIYLNPDIVSSEAAIHEYTHLWDNYTKVTNLELWQKGKEVFKNTYLWEEVKNDPNYQDIANDEDLILSECHARITGKIADQILDRILTENGKLAKDSVIDWDKEVFEYISKKFSENEIDIKSLSEFVSQTMKDFMEGKKLIYESKPDVISKTEKIEKNKTVVKNNPLAPVMTSEEFSKLYGRDFKAEELPIWKATDWEGNIDTSKLSFQEENLLHESSNYVEIEPEKFTHRVLFESGDIGSKIEDYKAKIKVIQFNNEDSAERKIALYEKNIAELEKISPNKIPIERLHFGLNSTLAEEFMVEHISSEGEIVKLNLQESFILWAKGQTYAEVTDKNTYYWRGGIDFATANISQEDFPQSVSWYDIVEYIDKKPVKAERVTGTWNKEDDEIKADKAQARREAEEKRMARSETADKLFDKYLHEGLSEDLSKRVEAEYNRRFNSYVIPDYSKLPLFIDGMSRTKNGKKFKLYDQQIKGVSFLCNKGNGLLAYDVGVGKTAAGIVATVNQIQTGRSKRPVIVVPNAVYAKWYNDICELFPNIKVNDLYNLNKESTEKYRNKDNPHKLDIEENSISLITYEGLKNITFNDQSCENELFNDFSKLLSVDFDGSSRENAKNADNIKNVIGISSQVKNTNYVFFEDCGFDNITVDEAHNFKNLWTVPRPKNKGESNEFAGIPSGKPSARALKLFAMTQYTQRHNDDRNVFLLTATPFTNSPLEVYSMLSYVGRKRLIDSGLYSLRDFCNQFAHTKLELGVNSKGEIDQKQVMKDWKELPALQKILTEFIDKVDGEELKEIIRPKKFTHVQELEMSSLQKQMMEIDTQLMNEVKEGNSAAVIVSMNAMRVGLVAPALADPVRYPDLELPSMEKLVETSPKLKFVCDSVIDMYKNHPEKGQFIFMPLGQTAHGIVKDYLIAHGIPKETVEIINGSINNTTEKKDKLTQKFNNPKEKCKILIGGKNTSEGIDLNGNSFAMYNCSLGWNPSETIQAEGRIWRQGNQQGHVHCVYPVMNDSIDSLLYQKHDEKRSRINELWTYKDSDTLNIEDINPEDLKFDLIKDPQKRAKLILENGIDTDDFKFVGTKSIKNELNKVNNRIKSFDEVYEKQINLKKNLEEAEFNIQRIEKNIEDYKNADLETPEWCKAELKDNRKYKTNYEHQLETISRKFASWGIKDEKELEEFIPNLNKQKRTLEAELQAKEKELPKILKMEMLKLNEKKVLLPSISEQRKILTEDIQKNLRPMTEVEPEIRTERFEQMLNLKWERGEISAEEAELYSSVGYKDYYAWLDGEIESLGVENIIEKQTEIVQEKTVDISTDKKVEEKQNESNSFSGELFSESELEELTTINEKLNPQLKKHQVIYYYEDSGIDEGLDFITLAEAQKEGKSSMKEWELDKSENGFAVFNKDTKQIEAIHGYFPIEKVFRTEILKINGYKVDETKTEVSLSEIQKSAKEKQAEQGGSKEHFDSHVVFATPNKTKKEYEDSYEW